MKVCETPRGRDVNAQNVVMLRRFAGWASSDLCLTHQTRTVPIDALFVRAGVVCACAEAKTRPTMNLAGLRARGSLLLSANKLPPLLHVSGGLYVVGLVVIGLSDVGVFWEVCRDGVLTQPLAAPEIRTTQDTVYGGTKQDAVVYLPLTTMRFWSRTCPY